MKIKPLSEYIVAKVLDAPRMTQGGLHLPDSAQAREQTRAEVLEVGPGRMNEQGDELPMRVKKGDQIIFGDLAAAKVTLDGEEYLILREANVMAVVGGRE
jgi:chaperonin GroES